MRLRYLLAVLFPLAAIVVFALAVGMTYVEAWLAYAGDMTDQSAALLELLGLAAIGFGVGAMLDRR